MSLSTTSVNFNTPPLTVMPRIRSAQPTNCTQRFLFERSYEWSRLTQFGAGPMQGAPCRLKSIGEASSSSHVRKTKIPFFACSGVCRWTRVMAFLIDATPAHEFGNMKDPLPSITTMFPLSITPDTASKGLWTLAPWNVARLEMSPPPCRWGRTFTFSVHLHGPRIVVLSPSPLMVSDQHLAILLDSQLILLHWSQLHQS